MIYQIAYWSKAKIPLSQSELTQLAEHAKADNLTHKITGFLLYGHHTFFQIIEGNYEQVAALYQKISADNRHHQLEKIGEWCVAERQYSNWAMGFAQLAHPNQYHNYQNLHNWRSEQLTQNKDAMRRLLLEYANLHQLTSKIV